MWTLSFVRPYKRRVTALAALSTAEIALRALGPWPLKMVVDHLVAAERRASTLLILVAAALLAQLAHELVLMLHTRMQARLAQQMVYDVRSRLFSHLQYLSLAHHTKSSAADAVYRMDADAGCIESLLLKGVFPSVFSALTLIVMFTILVRLDAVLALLSMAIVPVLYAHLRWYTRRMRPQAERARTVEAAVVGRLYESLAAIRLVKTFAREEYELTRFQHVATEANRERMSVTRQESLFGFVVSAVTAGGAAMVLAVGSLHVMTGQLTIGTLLVVIAYLGFVYGPLSGLATTGGSLHHAMVSARRVREILAVAREADDERDAVAAGPLRGEVTFEGVSFSYGPGRPVLDEVSFAANAGETIALVGPSGAGKSTLASLIGRLYEPTAGRVLIDGVDVRRYRLKSLREQIAVVSQDAVLFSGSIADNLLYGRLDATERDVVRAAAAAHAQEFIAALGRGFDTPIGEGGIDLSGGQRQRLSIARAFLRDAPILILDEPTAALDAISEQAVLGALQRLQRRRTTFVIAHRLSTVRHADRIIVLEAGRVVAEGHHAELLISCALYRQLCAHLADAEWETGPQGMRTIGACQNAAFCPVGSRTVT